MISNSGKFLRVRHGFLSATLPFLALLACDRAPDRPEVVIYTSVDQVFAEQVLADFERETGVRVNAVFDTEAGKTTGFLRRLLREKPRPRCDVWWSSEVFGTIEVAREEVLAAYAPEGSAGIPEAWKSANGMWTGSAARARVVAYHPDRIEGEQIPSSWAALSDSPLLARMAVANPQFGTTRGHVAAMFAYWGTEAATGYLQKLREAETPIADGNAHCVRMLASGQADVCWTDTDDVWSAKRRGEKIELAYLPLDDEHGAIWIPNSVALVAGGPNPEAGRELIDFLVSERVERALYASDSRNVPVRAELREELGYDGPAPTALDFERVADALPQAMEAAREILLH